jgi:hypothetical protein
VTELRYTLVCDGSSDQALLPVINWSLRKQRVTLPVNPAWADLTVLRHHPNGLEEKIRSALELYPCDLLFVHRDCETQTVTHRQDEIRKALEGVFPTEAERTPAVCIVPRRMTEAWLLISERVIRSASEIRMAVWPLRCQITMVWKICLIRRRRCSTCFGWRPSCEVDDCAVCVSTGSCIVSSISSMTFHRCAPSRHSRSLRHN